MASIVFNRIIILSLHATSSKPWSRTKQGVENPRTTITKAKSLTTREATVPHRLRSLRMASRSRSLATRTKTSRGLKPLPHSVARKRKRRHSSRSKEVVSRPRKTTITKAQRSKVTTLRVIGLRLPPKNQHPKPILKRRRRPLRKTLVAGAPLCSQPKLTRVRLSTAPLSKLPLHPSLGRAKILTVVVLPLEVVPQREVAVAALQEPVAVVAVVKLPSAQITSVSTSEQRFSCTSTR